MLQPAQFKAIVELWEKFRPIALGYKLTYIVKFPTALVPEQLIGLKEELNGIENDRIKFLKELKDITTYIYFIENQENKTIEDITFTLNQKIDLNIEIENEKQPDIKVDFEYSGDKKEIKLSELLPKSSYIMTIHCKGKEPIQDMLFDKELVTEKMTKRAFFKRNRDNEKKFRIVSSIILFLNIATIFIAAYTYYNYQKEQQVYKKFNDAYSRMYEMKGEKLQPCYPNIYTNDKYDFEQNSSDILKNNSLIFLIQLNSVSNEDELYKLKEIMYCSYQAK